MPLLTQKCVKCHGGEEVNGKVNFKQVATAEQLLANPELIHRMIGAISVNDMPPEGEPQFEEKARTQLLAALKTMLRRATTGSDPERRQIRRLNRFQYNNSVRDLFQLKLDVFELPEKLMTRYDDYLFRESDKMPDQVRAVCHSLKPKAGLKGVNAFPKDLRAEHGFDNQSDQLTLSPLLLDAFLRLSVSIVESPDFNEQNVGIWNDLFQPPAEGADRRAEVDRKLETFLKIAFRGPVDLETRNRYATYAVSKMDQGLSFTDGMKKAVSAVLSSPMFLYRSASQNSKDAPFELAADLSYFLWGSCPDLELLRLAETGELTDADVLNKTVERMLADPKIERFLDAFPAQWMQLENVLAATPDPKINRIFSLDPASPASLQMVLEPLLLFDAVFVEDRPIRELISPGFSFRNDFLTTWYTTDLKPPPLDVGKITAENDRNDQQRKKPNEVVQAAQSELEALLEPVRAKLLAARSKNKNRQKPVDLKPYAAWEFNGDLKDSVHSLDLSAEGRIEFEDGMVVLRQAYLTSRALPIDLQAKTLEVWCRVADVKQRGGGVMSIQGPAATFDSIVLGERKPGYWISGSNGFLRTEDFAEATAETQADQPLHLAMVYAEDGTIALYRNGVPYGKPYRAEPAKFPKKQSSVLFGLRHLPPAENKFLTLKLDKARLYDRALTAAEVALSAGDGELPITDDELLQALTDEQKAKHETLSKSLAQARDVLARIPPNQDLQKLQQEALIRFDDEIRNKLRSQIFKRVAALDPRYGGVITNAAMLSMTSGPKRTHPIARGAWIIEVIFNDPPPPPPNDVPPLNEDASSDKLTIREKFAAHRSNPSCAGCHSRLDPLGFALENFDITGRWRNKYENGAEVDSSGTLMRKYKFDDVVGFKESLVIENQRFATALTAHLLRFALSRELGPADSLTIEAIVAKTQQENFKLKSLIREVALSASALHDLD